MSTTDIFKSPDIEVIPKIALSVQETALAIGVSDRTVHSLIKSGELPTMRIGTRQLVPTDVLREWCRERTRASA